MLNVKSFLTVDFGAGSLKAAEFEVNEAGGLRLKQYGIKSLGAEGSQESSRESVMLKALQELIAEKGIRSKSVNVCAPGFHVFSKFVKLPPVETSKVTQIIQYEAQQNVPFPLSEVVWDYQILGSTPTGELEVLLVAIKSDIVEGLFRVTETSGLRLQLADVSPAALCNAFRYNYGDLEDCTMLLDIGAKTSNLLFFEKNKVYARSINLGANSITQDFANESKLAWKDAEEKKIAEGFVSLGGAYEEPENAHQAAISKIARQFMTRLHIQVNQTMQFYRGQQGGSAPNRLFLCGGASLMPYTAQFFAEKLNVPVEYFNPFRNVQIDPATNLEELARVAHSLGEVVGLGLRNLAHCPVELNLMPESTLNWVQFNQKKPYFIATIFSLVLVVFASGFLFSKLADVNRVELDPLKVKIAALQQKEQQFKKAMAERTKAEQEATQFANWITDRYYWGDVLTDLHNILITVENTERTKLNTDAGVWIEKFVSAPTDDSATGGNPFPPNHPPSSAPGQGYRAPLLNNRGPGGLPGGRTPGPMPPPPAAGGPPGRPGASTNVIDTITMVCRGVDITAASGKPSADTDLMFDLEQALKASSFLDSTNTALVGDNVPDPNTGTFTFGVTLKLKHPLKMQ
jgi:type IV pilus assembly protein PilM